MTTTYTDYQTAVNTEVIPALASRGLDVNDYHLLAVTDEVLDEHGQPFGPEPRTWTVRKEFQDNPEAIVEVAEENRWEEDMRVRRTTLTLHTPQGEAAVNVAWRPLETNDGEDVFWEETCPARLIADRRKGGALALVWNLAYDGDEPIMATRVADDAPYLEPGQVRIEQATCADQTVPL